jgi:hypothetical protein
MAQTDVRQDGSDYNRPADKRKESFRSQNSSGRRGVAMRQAATRTVK